MGTAIAPDNTGDLQVIFGTSQKEKSWFFETADIDVFSIHKPFVYPQEVFNLDAAGAAARLTAARMTRFGFAVNNGHIAPSAGETWVYTRPNGNLLTQPRRTDDFEGYYHKAPCPFKIEAEVRKGTGAYASIKGYISVMLSVNSAVSSLWEEDYSMGIQDFFNAASSEGADDLWDYYHIAFKIVNKSRGSTYAPTVIVTNTTLKDWFTNSEFAYFNFPEVTQDQWNYLGILDQASEGDVLEIMAFLNSPVTTQAGHDYEVFTGNDAAFWTAGFSLAFKAGVDRVETTVQSMYSISGTTGSITSVTNRDDGIVTPTYQGQPMTGLPARAFLNTVNMSIDTRGASSDWSMLPNGLTVSLVIEIEIISTSYSEVLFAPDNEITHNSVLETIVKNNHVTYVWRCALQLRNNQQGSYSRSPITPSKWIEDLNAYATDPDKMLVVHPTSGTSTVTFQVNARLEKGAETVDLGSSQQYTLTY
jgi:hypothetical protein